MKIDFDKMTRNFILNEGNGPSVISYIQSLAEALNAMRPNTVADSRRLEIAKENLSNVKRHFRRLEEKISFLEEELKILQEEKSKTVEE